MEFDQLTTLDGEGGVVWVCRTHLDDTCEPVASLTPSKTGRSWRLADAGDLGLFPRRSYARTLKRGVERIRVAYRAARNLAAGESDMAKLKDESRDALDEYARTAFDPYARRAALEIAYLTVKGKLPESLGKLIVKADRATIDRAMDKITTDRPEGIRDWLIQHEKFIEGKLSET